MPPRKNADKNTSTPKSAKEKTPRPKKTKENVQKPKIKTPAVLKVKTPAIKNALSLKKSQANTLKKSTAEPEIDPIIKRKIDLANEVIRTQLAKPDKKALLLVEVANTAKQRAVKRKITNVEEAKSPKNPPGPKRNVIKKPPQVKRNKLTDDEKPKTNGTTSKQPEVMITPQIPAKRKYVRKKLVVTDSDFTDAGSTPERKSLSRKGKRQAINNLSTADNLQSPSLLDDTKKIIKNVVADDKEKDAKIEEKPEPVHVDSRKTSTSECLSWTRDISSSNTTISCLSVRSNDIVKIDNKLPVVMVSKELADAKRNTNNDKCESSSSESDSESSCTSSCSSCTSSLSTESRFLRLSSSSASIAKSNVSQNSEIKRKMENSMAKITQKLKQFESHVFLGIDNKFSNSASTDIFNNKIFKLLKEENEIINYCRKLEDYFKSSNLDCVSNFNKPIENATECSRGSSPKNYTDKSEEDNNFTSSKSKYVMFEQNCTEENPLQTGKAYNESSEDDNFTSDKVKYTTFEGSYNDDDDALSLFAESITGIESSRVESSANSVCPMLSDVEEYIPQPKTNLILNTSPKYIPTKISAINDSDYYKNTEKNNSDSGTLHKNIVNRGNHNADKVTSYRDSSHTFDPEPVSTLSPQVAKMNTGFLNSKHKPLAGVKSTVFRGVCFYNLISNCKKAFCIYPHVQPDPIDVKNKLTKLSNDTFIQEYLLLRGWPDLRREYGVLYVLECINRKLTRVLLEMAIDFIAKAKSDVEEAARKIDIVEKILLYLNETDLSDCVDLLQFNFNNGLFLCDVFMQVIADTQNFTRFKTIFVKLTNFNASIGRKFSLDVASNILERVYILPYEEQLVRALLKILENTDVKIFKNSIIPEFEAVIASSIIDEGIYEEFTSLKRRAFGEDAHCVNADAAGSIRANDVYMSADGAQNAERVTEEQPEIHQKVIRLNHVFKPSNVSRQTSVEEFRSPVIKRNWPSNRGKDYLALIKHMRFPESMRRHPRPPLLLKRRADQRQVLYEPRLSDSFGKFPRLPAPNFF